MKHFSLCMEKPEDLRKALSVLLSIESHHKNDYSCVISGNKELRRFIDGFPFTFTGKIEVLDEIDNRRDFHTLITRKLKSIKYAINKFGNTIHLSSDIFQIRPIEINEEVTGIGFIKKYSGPAPDMESQRYSMDVMYIEDVKYCDFVLEKLAKLVDDERSKHEYENDVDEDEDEDKDEDEDDGTSNSPKPEFHYLSADMIEKYKDFWKNVTVALVDEYKLEHFLSFRTCLGSEDFFSYDKPLNMHQINKEFTITIKEKVDTCDEEGEKVTETVENKYDYMFVGPRVNQHAPQVQDVNRALFSKLVSYKLSNMSIINMKYSKSKLDFVCPKKDGIGIWNREKDVPGMYNLLSYLVKKYNDYFSLTEDVIEYYSFNNYLLTDKPGMMWLTNNVRKYTQVLMCNYDKSLLDIKDTLPIPTKFFAYYSDHPEELDHYALNNTNKKTKQIVEIDEKNNEVVYTKGISVEKREMGDLTFIDKMNAISVSKYIRIRTYDVNMFANALAVSTIPVIPDDMEVQGLVEDRHYVRESKYTDDLKHSNMKINCRRYYENEIAPDMVIKKLLNHVFIGSV